MILLYNLIITIILEEDRKMSALTETWSEKNIHSKKKKEAEAASGETKEPSKNKPVKKTKKGTSTSNAEWNLKFSEMTQLSIVEQAEKFLMQFVMEFQGRFSEVTDMALEFQSFAGPLKTGEHVQELDEFQCHQFLEKRGETLTVADLRKELKEIDIDVSLKHFFPRVSSFLPPSPPPPLPLCLYLFSSFRAYFYGM
jgi:hypothetical protein